MILGTPLFHLCRKNLCYDEEQSGEYSDTLRAMQEDQPPQLDFLKGQTWIDGADLPTNPWELIHTGENLLAAQLLISLAGRKVSEFPSLLKSVEIFTENGGWPQVSLVSAQIQLLKVLASFEITEDCASFEGYQPFAAGHYWAWADIPFMVQHAQLGIIHALLGFLRPDLGYRTSAKAIADWHTQLLDSDGSPTTLYQREGAANENQLLATHYILYRAIAQLHQCPRSSALCQNAITKLHQYPESPKLPLYLHAVETFLASQLQPPTPEINPLPQMIADPNILLAGYRTPERSFVCSLSGSRTGLGYVRKGDVKIVSYGPQSMPLAECQQYGIEAPALLGEGAIQVGDAEFRLSRKVKLPNQPPLNKHPATFGMLPPPYEYAEVKQEYFNEVLHISYKPYSMVEESELGFAFFAKALNCLLPDGTLIKPRSLKGFDGKSQPVTLQGNNTTITLLPGTELGAMQIIPLAGGDAFWGADYLIAFKTPDAGCSYQWKLN